MRASSLSNLKVIDLLNHYFIPVHADGVYYKKNEKVPADERAAYERVFQELHQLNRKNSAAGKPPLSIGSVHAYVLGADGKPLDSLHVAEAKPEQTLAMLERAIQSLKVTEGEPAVKPSPQSVAPQGKPDSLILHLTARYLVPRSQAGARPGTDDEYVPVAANLGGQKSGGWNALPSEDWIELPRGQWLKLLPAAKVDVGTTWNIAEDLATQLLTRFYPTTENNDLSTNRIERQSLEARVIEIKGNVVRARVDGSLKMKHAFYPHREDDNVVEAAIVGYLDFEQDKPRIQTLRLVTKKASYGGPNRRFGVAVRSVPTPAN